MSNPNDSENDSRLRVGILWPYAESSSLYLPWLHQNSDQFKFFVLKDYRKDNLLLGLDVLVTHMHYRWDELSCLEFVLQQGKTSVLVIADGVLEFRNSWQNPGISDGSMLRPAFAHKVAAIGCGQARLLESWGNQGRCEVVGLPRLDELIQRHHWRSPEVPTQETRASNRTRLLICSATTPAFTDEQWATTFQSFNDLQQCVDQWNQHQEHQIDVTWRVANEIVEQLNLPVVDSDQTLIQAIGNADAVVTTPSTIQLESMLCRKPTVLLSYFSTPSYLPSAWPVHCRQHIEDLLPELTEGTSPARTNFQDVILRDQLWLHDSATQRMLKLIQAMGEEARAARSEARPIRFANQLLPLVVPEANQSQAQYSAWHDQTMTPTLGPFDGDRGRWLEDSGVKAALLRAESAAEARAHVTRIETKMFGLQDNYEASLEDKRIHIANQSKLLDEAAQRHTELNQLLNSRNTEIDRIQSRIKELSDARIEDHKMLSEAYADAKAKQQRVNELREKNKELRERIDNLQAELSARTKSVHTDNKVIAETQNRLKLLQQTNQELVEHNKAMKENNSRLIENNKQLQEGMQRTRENNQRMSANTKTMQERIEKLIADQKLLRERLQKTESNTQ